MPVLLPRERIGTVVGGRYRIDKIIGSGGMGSVFAGAHTWTERQVAVKILHPDLAAVDEASVKRFFREAKASARLKHPNVVDILDMGETRDGVPFIVLELLDGESLAARLENGALDPDEALRVLLPVMDALERAHELGMVHRDIKPDNIFIAVDGSGRTVPKLLDFGITKLVDGQDSFATATGVLVGTPFYMSPEQAVAPKTVDARTDVWAIGVVFYEALTGVLPFEADLPISVIGKVIADDPVHLSEAAPWVPEPIIACIHRALAKDKAERPAGMVGFMDELLAAAHSSDVAVADPREVQHEG